MLAAGAGPTMVGYFLQGGLKFGGYELWKDVIASAVGAAAVARFAALVHMVPFGPCYFSSHSMLTTNCSANRRVHTCVCMLCLVPRQHHSKKGGLTWYLQ